MKTNGIKLGKILKIKHGYAFKGEYFSDKGSYILLTPGNFYEKGGFKYTPGKEKYYIGDFPKEYISKKDDLVVAMTEQAEGLLGSVALVPENDMFLHNQRIGLIDYDESKIEKYYLYYLFRMKSVRKQIKGSSSGTKVKHTSPDKIYDVVVNLPSIETQKKIGNLLYSLEEKIELNNKINKELEEMAKTIYDYWFVQFDFPDENGKPYKSSGGEMVWSEELKREIPKGWEVKKLKDIERNIITGKTPSTSTKEFFNGDIPFITIGDIRENIVIVKTEQQLSQEGAETQKNKYLPKGSMCVSCIASPGLIGFTTAEISQTNQQINSIIFENEQNKEYLYFAVDNFFKFSKQIKTGNIFSNMNKGDFESIKLIKPSEKDILKFNKVAKPIFDKVLIKSLENRELESLRDWLLPMLMNGQVKIK